MKKMDVSSKKENMEDKKIRTKKTFMWVIVGVLLIATIFLTIRASSAGTGQAISGSGTGSINTAGWTENEVMNYQMHGVIPARASGSTPAGSGSSSQVGNC